MTKVPDIKYLFEPRSVAIIGASSKEEKVGYKVLRNILASGYEGRIYPVNRSGGQLQGVKTYKSIDEIDGEIDLATIVVPAKFAFDSIKQCVDKGAKFLSIITSGFSEVGNLEEEKKIVQYAWGHGARVLGPNIFGIYSASSNLNATFGPKAIKKGNVAIVTQSGALGIAMMGKTMTGNMGLSAVVSVGNKSDLDEADLLEYLIDDDNTKVILMYIEGIKSGGRLVKVLKMATGRKPVVVIKSGRSKRGSMAAASHTGSLAGADEIFSDVMRQCGVLRAESIENAFNWCNFLSITPEPSGKATVIITNGGGMGVMAADACEKYDVDLYDDMDTLKSVFTDSIPSFGSYKNPVDITGGATLEDYEKTIRAAIEHDEIDSIICLGCETAVFDKARFKSCMEGLYKEVKDVKPMILSFMGSTQITQAVHDLKASGVPIYDDVYEAVSCLGALYHNYRNIHDSKPLSSDLPDIDFKTIQGVVDAVLQEGRSFLLADEAQKVMEAAGMSMPRSKLAHSLDQAVKFAEEIGYPVVMKVVSKEIIHKSDAGGVALDLEHKEEVMDAYQAIMRSCRAYNKKAVIKGIEVVEMVLKGTETIIGARIDPGFGPVLMFGLGGIYVEVMKDVSFRALPLDRTEALAMVKDIRSYPLLLGVRGEKRKDIPGVVDALLRIGAIIQNCKSISDIEINPLVAYEHGRGVKAVDARILLSKQKEPRGD